jgi:hypothetical protein
MEAGLEASMLTSFIQQGIDSHTAHKLAKESFTIWENFDLSYSLKSVLDHKEQLIENGIYDDLLIKALSNHHDPQNPYDVQNGIVVLNELSNPVVFETFHKEIGQYLISYDPQSYRNISYMKPYTPTYQDYFQSFFTSDEKYLSEDGKKFASEYYAFLQKCDEYQKKGDVSKILLEDVLDLSFRNALENLFDSSVSSLPSNNLISVKGSSEPAMMLPIMPVIEIASPQVEHFV